MSALGSLVVKLALEYAEYTKGLSKSDQESLRFAQNVQKHFDAATGSTKEFFTGVVQGAIAAGAAYLTVSAAIDRFNKSVASLSALDDLAQKTGSSVESLSKIQRVATEFEQDFGVIDSALTKFAKEMAGVDEESSKAGKALAALGLSAKDSAGNIRDPAELFVEVAKRLQDYEDGAGKAAVMNDLLGKSGADLLPFLNDLAESVDQFGGYSTEAASNAAAFEDRLNHLRARADDLFTKLAIDLLPHLNDLIDAFIDAKEESDKLSKDKGLTTWADDAVAVAAFVIDAFDGVGRVFELAGKRIASLAAAGAALVTGDLAGAGTILDAFKQDREEILMREMFSARFARSRANRESSEWTSGSDLPFGAGSGRQRLNYTGGDGDTEAAKKAARERAKAEKEAYDLVMKAARERSDLRNAEYAEIEKYLQAEEAARVATVKAANDAVEAAQWEYDTYGMTRSQVEQLTLARLKDKQAAATEGSADHIALQQQIEAREKLIDIYRRGELREASIRELEEASEAAQKIMDNLTENMQRNLGDGLYDMLDGNFKNIGDAFNSMLNRMVADAAAADIMSFLRTGQSGGNLIGLFSAVGSLIAGQPMGEGWSNAEAGSDWSQGLVPSAKGNVFSAAQLVPFAKGGAFTNGIVTEPTVFPLGLMGEDGEEAIMPLKRGADGKLGVQATGGGKSTVVHFSPTYNLVSDTELEQKMHRIAQRQTAELAELMDREGVN